jgi:hypothetical protein
MLSGADSSLAAFSAIDVSGLHKSLSEIYSQDGTVSFLVHGTAISQQYLFK